MISVFSFLVICIAVKLAESDELLFVHAIYRHGDRSPTSGIPTDPVNGVDSWSQGWGELTPQGMQMHYELGQQFHARYADTLKFLQPDYSTNEIYLRSTDYNRTLESAYSNLAGMYQPTVVQVPSQWLEGDKLQWQPIPVHTLPLQYDNILWMDNPCNEYDLRFNEVITTVATNYSDYMHNYSDVIDYIRNESGLHNIEIASISQAFDPIFVEMVHNRTLPAWVNSHFLVHTDSESMNKTILEHLLDLQNLSYAYKFHDLTLNRLRGGVLLNDIIYRLMQKANGSDNLDHRLKFYIYSAHDSTLAALLETLGAFPVKGRVPGYAAALTIELWNSSSDGGLYIQVPYRVEHWIDFNTSAVYLQVSGCPPMNSSAGCPLDVFVTRSVKYLLPAADYNAACGNMVSTTTTQPEIISTQAPLSEFDFKTLAIVMGALAAVSLFLFVTLLVLYCRVRRKSFDFDAMELKHM